MFVIKDEYIPIYFMKSGDSPVYWTFDKKRANQFETLESTSRTIRKYGGIVEEIKTWNKWECHECSSGCIIFRKCNPYFKPDHCIYAVKGNGIKESNWKISK